MEQRGVGSSQVHGLCRSAVPFRPPPMKHSRHSAILAPGHVCSMRRGASPARDGNGARMKIPDTFQTCEIRGNACCTRGLPTATPRRPCCCCCCCLPISTRTCDDIRVFYASPTESLGAAAKPKTELRRHWFQLQVRPAQAHHHRSNKRRTKPAKCAAGPQTAEFSATSAVQPSSRYLHQAGPPAAGG